MSKNQPEVVEVSPLWTKLFYLLLGVVAVYIFVNWGDDDAVATSTQPTAPATVTKTYESPVPVFTTIQELVTTTVTVTPPPPPIIISTPATPRPEDKWKVQTPYTIPSKPMVITSSAPRPEDKWVVKK